MSYPANVVIRKNGHKKYMATHLYDPLPHLLLGPERLPDLEQEKCERISDGICYGWNNSGILMDFDTKTLLYFGGDNDWEIGARHVWDAFLSTQIWKGWTIRFAPRELCEFATALGDKIPDHLLFNATGIRHEIDYDTLKTYWINPNHDNMDSDNISSLIVLRKDKQEIIHSFAHFEITDALDHGEALISLLDTPGISRQKSSIDGYGICSSILIDVDDKLVAYWSVDQPNPQCYYAAIWKGWKVVDLGEDYRSFSSYYCDAAVFDEEINLKSCIKWIRRANNAVDYFNNEPVIEASKMEHMLTSFLEILNRENVEDIRPITLDELNARINDFKARD